jgi:hypothetical protein
MSPPQQKLISPADCELRTVELNTEKNKQKNKKIKLYFTIRKK